MLVVITNGFGEAVKLLDVATGEELRRFTGQGGSMSAVFSPDGQTVLTGKQGKTRLWDVATGTELSRFAGHSNRVTSVAFSPDGQTVLVGGNLGQATNMVVQWDLAAGAELRRFVGHKGGVISVTFSPDGETVLTGGNDKTARLWDATTGAQLRRIEGHASQLSSAAFSPDGQTVLTGSWDYTSRLWDVATGAELRRFSGRSYGVFSPDGRTVLTSSRDKTDPLNGVKTVRLWDVATGAELRQFALDKHGAMSLAISPDGKTMIMGSNPWNTARLWDMATGVELRRFVTQKNRPPSVTSVAFSPDGQFVLMGDRDKTAVLWDVATGTELRRFVGHKMTVNSVAFSPDGQVVLTASDDKTARLWDVTTGAELAQLISFADGTWAVIDPAGRFDASNSGDVDGLHWVSGLEAIKLSQLKDRYYEPGLLAKILGIKKEPVRDVVAFSEVALYPELSLQAPTADRSSLDIKLKNKGGGLGRVWVAINGKEIATDARGDGFDSSAEAASIAVDLKDHPYLVAGADNTIEVKVYNTEGYLASRGQTVTWRAPGVATPEAPELWAVVVGVSDYSGDTLDLNFAAKDAAVFSSALQNGAKRLFGAERVHLVRLGSTDGSADISPTRDNLVLALQGLSEAKPTDVVLVYLAGHAVTHGGQDGDYFFLTQQATSFDLNDPAVRSEVALSSDDLTELLKLTPANKQVLILDTCGAGTVVQRMTNKRGVPSSQIRALDRMKDRTGLFVLAGSAADAVSYEASAYGQGLLTYSLLEGMRGAALREDEYLDVSRWFDYAADRVPVIAENVGGIQRPLVAMPRGTGSFDVARLTKSERGQIELQQPLPFVIQSIFQLEGPPIDPLDLTPRVNAALRDVSSHSTHTPWVFVDTPEYADSYQLSGRYKVNTTTDEVIVDVYLLRESEVVSMKTVAGTSAQINSLVKEIIAFAEDLL
jgi:WD40 repeat protein